MNFDNSKNGHFSHLAPVLQNMDKSLYYNTLGFSKLLFISWIVLSIVWTIGAWYVFYFALHQVCDIQYCSYT